MCVDKPSHLNIHLRSYIKKSYIHSPSDIHTYKHLVTSALPRLHLVTQSHSHTHRLVVWLIGLFNRKVLPLCSDFAHTNIFTNSYSSSPSTDLFEGAETLTKLHEYINEILDVRKKKLPQSRLDSVNKEITTSLQS